MTNNRSVVKALLGNSASTSVGMFATHVIATCKRSLGQGKVFTPVCQSFCLGGWCTPQSRHPSRQTPTPSRQTPYPSWADTPCQDTPLGRHPLGRHPLGRHTLPDANCSGWYASYWNAFLFFLVFLIAVLF